MNPAKILCWNVRGLNSRARQDTVRTLITSCQVDVVCLQETKMPGISRGCILSLLGSDFPHWLELPAIGASGGILVAWRHRLGPANATRLDTFSVSIQFSPANSQNCWLVSMALREMITKSSSCKNSEMCELHALGRGWYLEIST